MATTAKAREQQFIRLYDEHKRILQRLNDELAPGLALDRSMLIRGLMEYGGLHVAEVADLIRSRSRETAK